MCVAILVVLMSFFTKSAAESLPEPEILMAPPAPEYVKTMYEIQSGDVLLGILIQEGNLPYDRSMKVLDQVNELHDATKIKAGSLITFTRDATDKKLFSMEYDVSDSEYIKVLFDEDDVTAQKHDIVYEVREASGQGVIQDSLYVDGTAAGLTDRMIMEIARVFAWDVDFTSSIQEGDQFALFYENRYRDGEFVGTGDIIAATFTNKGNTFYAYRVIDEMGAPQYFSETGASKKRLFLKTPLNYRRISSGFTNSRKHPILGDFRSHRALDLAADTGTPVETVGDGTVTFAGYKGALGNYIRIKHASGYETGYAHLSKIYVKKGATVTQGDVIGAVGSTGRSTGPHLHYEMFKNGQYVNAFEIEVPPVGDIAEQDRPALDRVIEQYQDALLEA